MLGATEFITSSNANRSCPYKTSGFVWEMKTVLENCLKRVYMCIKCHMNIQTICWRSLEEKGEMWPAGQIKLHGEGGA